MTAHTYEGGCHCGNIVFTMETVDPPGECNPRACDCDFCLKHAASYVSDPRGKLAISVKDESGLSRYRQGDRIADFLVCGNCGVLVAVCYEENGRLFATVNSRAVAGRDAFGETKTVSPKKLGGQEKIERWKSVWFGGVVFRCSAP